MKGNARAVAELEAELMRLNTLVRARRRQLERLKACPNKDCECRRVWREQVEKRLAGQVRKIRKQVRGGTTAPLSHSRRSARAAA